MATIYDLPPEILEQIVLELDPIHVAQLAQTCKSLYSLVYDPEDEHLWRLLYLAQPLDDPRQCLDELCVPSPPVSWKRRLQRIMRARTVVKDPTMCRKDERIAVLHTLLELICNLPPIPSLSSDDLAYNLVWMAAQLRGGAFLDVDDAEWAAMSSDEQQLHARLHTYFGLTTKDYKSRTLKFSRMYVYAMRNYKWDNDFGPFMMDGSGRVNWVHMQKIHHVMSMHVVPGQGADEEPATFTIFPMSLPYCQSVIPRGLDLNVEEDWAGVTGVWQCAFCFCDHRELLVYNNMNESEDMALNTSVFDDPNFVEVFRSIDVKLRVLSTEADPDHPTRPRIKFGGSIDQEATMVGWVRVTPDNQIRWHFKSGEEGNAIWSSEGVQVGGVRSSFGILGAWTTVHHDRLDPVGPFWFRKIQAPDDLRGLDQDLEEGN